jgi:enoyl-CoA hydratase/carnithine racemase
MGGMAGAMQLSRHLPATTAWEMALTGEPIDADEAFRVHLVNRIVPPDALLDEAQRIAGLITRHPPLAVRIEVEALRRSEGLAPDDAYVLGMSSTAPASPSASPTSDTFLYEK